MSSDAVSSDLQSDETPDSPVSIVIVMASKRRTGDSIGEQQSLAENKLVVTKHHNLVQENCSLFLEP